MRRYGPEIGLLLFTLVLCLVAIRVFGQEQFRKEVANDPIQKAAPASILNPGDEVKPLELESAKLGKLKAQIARDEAQETVLQQQFSNLELEKRTLQASWDSLVKDVQARVKKETGAEVVYDPRTGEDGTFHVNTVPTPPLPPPAKKQP
jgi:hypothetical protein